MVQVTVLQDGINLQWSCDECMERGMGWHEMCDHLLRTGHEWFTRGARTF